MTTKNITNTRRVVKQGVALLGLTACLLACITPFQPSSVSVEPMLIVDGQVTDQPGPYTVRLTRTSDYSIKSVNLLETGATVTISDNLGNQETLKEQAPGGSYQSSANGLRGVPGRRYKLTILTKAGKRYESESEVMPAVPPIKNVYAESNYTPATATTNQKQTWSVYIDTKDPDTLGNYYKWSWTHYEMPTACRKTFVAARSYYTGISCCTDCWDITRCYTCVNINSDVNINGKAISRQPIADVPFTSLSRYYLEVEQQALSKNAYLFWKSVQQLTGNTGGLFDVAPSSVQGNIKCITTPGEPVYGYFGAAGVSVSYLYVDRTEGQGGPDLDFPTNIPYPTNPSCVVCENSLYRTPIKPRFWTY
ncbi:DUF4249 domain-containing protein [Spirosoma fluviale]|uniref:DUF4249 domain-containing protein n=1 Tax=Spirosoma fluviale TaxID=1597977 RepID=A0A286FAG1_9BACT|nr:DUF4249 domain-containing protein [Spirosoma fluviale]SOD79834.1 protein of unknown function [Spirosoma fluviale]